MELKALLGANSAILLDAGYNKNLQYVTVEDKEEMIRTLFLHYTIYGNKAELKLGLNILGIADEMKVNSEIFNSYFTCNDHELPLSAGLYKL